jgi:hypothetical protein
VEQRFGPFKGWVILKIESSTVWEDGSKSSLVTYLMGKPKALPVLIKLTKSRISIIYGHLTVAFFISPQPSERINGNKRGMPTSIAVTEYKKNGGRHRIPRQSVFTFFCLWL